LRIDPPAGSQVRLRRFGVKTDGLYPYGHLLASATRWPGATLLAAAAQVAATETDWDTAIEQARAEADRRVSAAEAYRDQAQQAAADAEEKARLAQQEATRAQTAEAAASAETEKVRADAERMLAQFRAEAARERHELCADLRARAEREADAYRDELARTREPGNWRQRDRDSNCAPRALTRQAGNSQAGKIISAGCRACPRARVAGRDGRGRNAVPCLPVAPNRSVCSTLDDLASLPRSSRSGLLAILVLTILVVLPPS
jgi:hypothetical protein